jgi:hypothetical protein
MNGRAQDRIRRNLLEHEAVDDVDTFPYHIIVSLKRGASKTATLRSELRALLPRDVQNFLRR